VTGKYIRPDLVCFGCFGDATIMRDRGLVTEQGQLVSFSFSCSHPVVALSCAFEFFSSYCLSSFQSFFFQSILAFNVKNCIPLFQNDTQIHIQSVFLLLFS